MSDLPGMQVHERQPYAGDLVFTAFSGSHQDAIAKGMAWREEKRCETLDGSVSADRSDRMWEEATIPMLSVSTASPVRAASDYILKQSYGINLPEKMREEVGYLVKGVSDQSAQRADTGMGISDLSTITYVNAQEPYSHIDEVPFQADGRYYCRGNDPSWR